jgi:hypothetical protein
VVGAEFLQMEHDFGTINCMLGEASQIKPKFVRPYLQISRWI